MAFLRTRLIAPLTHYFPVGILALAMGVSPAMATDYMPSASDRLQAIKQALVDMALKADVKLGSTAYLDAAGVLHESTVMKSDTLVRGVRVLAYLEEAGVTVAKVDASILSDPACPGARPGIRRQASVRVVETADNSRVGDHYVSELATISQHALLKSLDDSKHWSVSAETAYGSSYERAVSGSAKDQVPYRFDIALRKRPALPYVSLELKKTNSYTFKKRRAQELWRLEKIKSSDAYKPWPSASLEYELTLVDHARGVPLWRKRLPVTYPEVDRGYLKDPVPAKFTQKLAAITENFLVDINATMDCQTQYYQLNKIPGGSNIASINAGRISGVNVGDQFLISTDANILNQALSISGLAGLALAQVDSVTAHSATIKHIAGPSWSGSVNQNVALHF